MKIERNSAKCKKCNDHIESTSVHDFKWCSCKTIAVDGGKEYLQRLYTNLDDWEDTSIYTGEKPINYSMVIKEIPDMIPI